MSIRVPVSDLDKGYYTRAGIDRLAMAIKASLRVKRLSERGLARLAGVSNVTINKYVRGNIAEPQRHILEAIAPFILRVKEIAADEIVLDDMATYEGAIDSLNALATDDYKSHLFGERRAIEPTKRADL